MTESEPAGILVHLDEPRHPIENTSLIRGWVAANRPEAIGELALFTKDGEPLAVTTAQRLDVEQALPEKVAIGFSAWIDIRSASRGLRVRISQKGSSAEADVPLALAEDSANRFILAKRKKLEFIRELLCCPKCKTALAPSDGFLICSGGHAFPIRDDAFDFLDDVARATVGPAFEDYVSFHEYDETLLALIDESTGPILDVGCGFRPKYRDNVINLEMVPYPTTDVISSTEQLPFADDTFDLVISVAVLEHLRDPFTAARELKRVLRPGGRVFAAVPHLVPFHGYPSHYYNATVKGLSNLFTGLDVERLDVPRSGSPIFLLTWMLQLWQNALPEEAAREFGRERVADLLGDPESLMNRRFVQELPVEAQFKIAASTALVGRKKL
jgi:SAM-dependent methyltransferase